MLKTKLLCAILLISFLSCTEVPTLEVLQRTIAFLKIVEIDGKKYIPYEDAYCNERMYKYSIDYTGPIGYSNTIPLENCNKIVGYDPQTYVLVTDYFEEIRKLAIKEIND